MLRIKFSLLMTDRERLQFAAKASSGTVPLKDRLAHLRRLRGHLKALGDADVPVVLAGATASGPPPAPAADPVAGPRGDFDKTNPARPASLVGTTASTMPAVPPGTSATGTPPAWRQHGAQACDASNHAAGALSDLDKTNSPHQVGSQKKSLADTRNNVPIRVDAPPNRPEHEMEDRQNRAGGAASNSDKTKRTTRSSTASTNSKTSTPASSAQEERAALAIRALLIRASSA
jgi:hypothetical protein